MIPFLIYASIGLLFFSELPFTNTTLPQGWNVPDSGVTVIKCVLSLLHKALMRGGDQRHRTSSPQLKHWTQWVSWDFSYIHILLLPPSLVHVASPFLSFFLCTICFLVLNYLLYLSNLSLSLCTPLHKSYVLPLSALLQPIHIALLLFMLFSDLYLCAYRKPSQSSADCAKSLYYLFSYSDCPICITGKKECC